MKSGHQLGETLRASQGETPPGAEDPEFLSGLGSEFAARRRRDHGALALGGAVLAVALVLFVMATRNRSAPQPLAPPETMAAEPATDDAVADDPDAALLLAAATLRLEGFGDRARAPERLRALIHEYPGTRSARLATELLAKALGDSR